jgi:hypothetical protein
MVKPTEKIDEHVLARIEKLFREVEQDKSKAGILKKELDRWNLFEKYEKRLHESMKKVAEKVNVTEFKEHDCVTLKDGKEVTIVHVHDKDHFEVEFHGVFLVSRDDIAWKS